MKWPTWLSHEPAWWIAVATAAVDLVILFFPLALGENSDAKKAGIIAIVTLLANGLGTRALVTPNVKLDAAQVPPTAP